MSVFMHIVSILMNYSCGLVNICFFSLHKLMQYSIKYHVCMFLPVSGIGETTLSRFVAMKSRWSIIHACRIFVYLNMPV